MADVTKLVAGLNAHQVHAFKRLAVPVRMALRESIEKNQKTVFVDFEQLPKKEKVNHASNQPTASHS